MPFPIKTIRLEKIFADKIFAAEFYYERAMYFDVAMQKNYVFSEKDLLPFEFVTSQWNKLHEVLNDMEKGKQIL